MIATSRSIAGGTIASALALAGSLWLSPAGSAGAAGSQPHPGDLFQPAAQCMACHNRLTTAAGEDVSFGTAWRASMMANSSRDPYWHAAVRREVLDYPAAAAEIENECSRCHMPMAHAQAAAAGRRQPVFASLPRSGAAVQPDPLAAEGVSCAMCHQITSDGLGEKASFSGGFTVDTGSAGPRRIFGPYDVEHGRTAVMRSATGLQPVRSTHIQRSEVCATCHTLYTHPLDPAAAARGEFPEQMPYQEWLQSDYRHTRSCQDCHMPVVESPTPIASVLGQPREGVSRHDFRGANFLMLGLLNRFRSELAVTALPQELDAAVRRTTSFLQAQSSAVEIASWRRAGNRLEAEVLVRNLAGHKLPTAYPSRRAWLSVTVTDGAGQTIFASGQVDATGAIAGNDNDRDGSTFEPHHLEITSPDQVQIYEAILGTHAGQVTTGLLTAVSYLKDNRLLPRGFDKRAVPGDVAVQGGALTDPDFTAGEDRVRYAIDAGTARGPFAVAAELWYQPIAFRWARNLREYEAEEPRRFVRYYDAMAPSSALVLSRAGRAALDP